MTNLLRTTPNPVLATLRAEREAALAAAKAEALAKAKTNFDVLRVQGVICTVDDAEDRAHRWSLVSDLALALGVPHAEVDAAVTLAAEELAELRQLHSVVASGESRREYLVRVDAVMSTLPKGTTERGRACTHKGRMGWKFRAIGLVDGSGRLYCHVCGASVVLPPCGSEPSADAKAAAGTLAEAAVWYVENGEEALAVYAAGGPNDYYAFRAARAAGGAR